MPPSKNVNAYGHIKPILDAVAEKGSGKYVLASEKDAIRWRAEANMYRKLISQSGPTNYDNIVIGVNDNVVTFKMRRVIGQFESDAGVLVEMTIAEPADPLLEAALKFANKVVGESND